MKKKMISLFMGAALCLSLLMGCGKDGTSDSSPEGNSDSVSESTSESEGEASNEEAGNQEAASTDPLEMITQGYYTYYFDADGMDFVAYFHFYEEQPVLGSVFYAGFANNGITIVGTYTVEEAEITYNCAPGRSEDMVSGTAPYTVTFYDFQGSELGKCGFDGNVLYNDSAVSNEGLGVANVFFNHDTDAASPYQAVYEDEVGVPYLDFVAEEPTSTLTLYHNAAYMDMMGMMIEGTWSMEESAEGYVYTLKPDSDTDTGAVVVVAADESTAVYTPDGGEAVELYNTASLGPKAVYSLSGISPLEGVGDVEISGTLYDDGSVEVYASIYGASSELDKGTWTRNDDGTVSLEMEHAGAMTSVVAEGGMTLRYQFPETGTIGDVDTELTLTEAGETAKAEYTMTSGVYGENNEYHIDGVLSEDGTVSLTITAYDAFTAELDNGTWTMEDGVFTFRFGFAGELKSESTEKGTVLRYVLTGLETGDVDQELVISAAE